VVSSGPEKVSVDLVVVRFARGMLLISLGLIYITINQSYYAHYHYIYSNMFPPMPFESVMGVYLALPMFASFVLGFLELIAAVSLRKGVKTKLIPYGQFLVISVVLELFMVIVLWSIGMLIVQGYGFFVFMAVLQFVLFIALVVVEVRFNFKER
jgi:hypothetical protein